MYSENNRPKIRSHFTTYRWEPLEVSVKRLCPRTKVNNNFQLLDYKAKIIALFLCNQFFLFSPFRRSANESINFGECRREISRGSIKNPEEQSPI